MPNENNQQKKSTTQLLQVIAELNAVLKNTVTPEEMAKVFNEIIKGIKKVEARLVDNVAKNKDSIDTTARQLTNEVRTLKRQMEKFANDFSSETSQKLENNTQQLLKNVQSQLKVLESKIPELPDYSDRFEEIESKIPEPLEELSIEEQREHVRNLLEGIEEESEKLKIEAIGDLRKELDELKKIRISGGGGITGAGARDLIKPYDLSPYLDGVTKTYNIPATWSIVSVACSSFPSVLRPTIDYTFTQTTITFTSEIEASTTLAQGQTVIITLVSA